MCIAVILCLGSILIINNNKAENKNNCNDTEIKTLKEAKYTPEEMLAFFKGEDTPDDMEAYYDIILNWYDYYSKDTVFINRKGELYSYDEYMKIKAERSEYSIKMSLPVVSKDFFITTLNKD